MIPLPPAECVSRFIQESQRLGIDVRWTNEGMTNLNAAYLARPGTPGVIKLTDGPHRPGAATPPLGWPKDGAPEGRQLSPQEAEAYKAQSTPAKVLRAISKLQPVNP